MYNIFKYFVQLVTYADSLEYTNIFLFHLQLLQFWILICIHAFKFNNTWFCNKTKKKYKSHVFV